MRKVVPFARRLSLRQEEEELLGRLQTGIKFNRYEGRAERRDTHGVVVLKGEQYLGVWVLLEGKFHYLPISNGAATETDDVEIAYQHSLSVIRQAV